MAKKRKHDKQTGKHDRQNENREADHSYSNSEIFADDTSKDNFSPGRQLFTDEHTKSQRLNNFELSCGNLFETSRLSPLKLSN